MRSVIQRVSAASVIIDQKTVCQINQGIVALVGIDAKDDTRAIDYMLEKMLNLRIFEDKDGKMNLSLWDIAGEILFVPNFTIYGDARKGRRPSYINGATPQCAREIFAAFCRRSKELYPQDKIGFGVFQADMKVSIVNDGPVTILLDSDKLL